MNRKLSYKVCIAVVMASVVAMLVLLYFIDPARSDVMPKCAFRLLTGLDCPSCGSSRAVHALLHGDIGRAFSFNPFLVVSVPYLIAVMWGYAKFLPGSGVVRRYAHHRVAMLIYVGLFCGWWVIRNL